MLNKVKKGEKNLHLMWQFTIKCALPLLNLTCLA